MPDTESSADIIRSINARDRKYRLWFVILMFLVILVLGGVAVLQAATIQQFKEQSTERADAIKALQEDNLRASARTNAYLQCIARFFAERNRSDLQLTDLEACNYERNGTIVPGVDITPTTSDTNSPAPAGSGNSGSQGSGAGESPTPVEPSEPETPANEPEPVIEVQPIRICVPLTDLCIVL